MFLQDGWRGRAPDGVASLRTQMRRTRIAGQVLCLVCVIVLGGCATKYQPMGFAGGYDDFRITKDTFEITFRGNGRTAAETVSRYVFRRASEVTLLHGFTHFVPLVETDQTRSYVHGSGGNTHTIVRPGLTMRIRCFKNPLSHADGLVEARQFLDLNFPDSITE